MKNKVFRIIYWPLFIFLFLVLGYSSCIAVNWFKDNNNSKKEFEILNKTDNNKEFRANITNNSADENESYFQKLKKTNKDTVAYIDVNLTDIHYPVLQANDNDYYLNHSFMKKKSEAGWVFLDYQNSSDFNDDNTIIYGHNRIDKTMFGSLDNLLKTDLSKSYPLIYISLEKEKLVYQVFSIYTVEAEDYYLEKNFDTLENKSNWLETIKKRNNSSLSVDVDKKDKILTLSTCYGNDNLRLVVHAKRII